MEDLNLIEIRKLHPNNLPYMAKNGKMREICKDCKLKWDV